MNFTMAYNFELSNFQRELRASFIERLRFDIKFGEFDSIYSMILKIYFKKPP